VLVGLAVALVLIVTACVANAVGAAYRAAA
jgi:hypothetical protein